MIKIHTPRTHAACRGGAQAFKQAAGQALPPSFFTQVLGLKSWSDSDQAAFAASVALFARDVAAAAPPAAGGAPWNALTLCAASLPGVCAAAAAALPGAPSYLRCAAGGGMLMLTGAAVEAPPGDAGAGAGAVAAELRRVRAAACAALFPAGAARDVHEFDPRAQRLTRILAADAPHAPHGGGGDDWFTPAEHLPGVAVADAAAAVAASPPPRWATADASATSVAAACPQLNLSMAALYAALARFAARDGAAQLRCDDAAGLAARHDARTVAAAAAQLGALRVAEEEPDDWETLA
jgi:hypothetical protein